MKILLVGCQNFKQSQQEQVVGFIREIAPDADITTVIYRGENPATIREDTDLVIYTACDHSTDSFFSESRQRERYEEQGGLSVRLMGICAITAMHYTDHTPAGWRAMIHKMAKIVQRYKRV
jgi:hypothetical protein